MFPPAAEYSAPPATSSVRSHIVGDVQGGIPLAVISDMRNVLSGCVSGGCLLAVALPVTTASPALEQRVTVYQVEKPVAVGRMALGRFTLSQLGILEKLNRADLDHLARLSEQVVPGWWASDELAYSALPAHYPSGARIPTLLVVHLPGQAFGAYEFGTLVRWGPLNSGGRQDPTPAGLFHLNWRSAGHASTVNPAWFLRWYFNFGNREGLAFHEYALPGGPASHGCIRLLARDARWLFDWGDAWSLDRSGVRILNAGTPVFIVGQYDFDAPPPWRSPTWLSHAVDLPALDVDQDSTS